MSWAAENRRTLGIAAAVLVVVATAIWWLGFAGQSDDTLTEGPVNAMETTPDQVVAEIPPVPVQLFFPGEGGRLYAETRALPLQGDAATQVTALMEALLQGPESISLRPPLGEGASLRRVYLMGAEPVVAEDGQALGEATTPASLAGRTVVLDFATEAGMPPRTTGSQRERLMFYSLVNTVLMNFEGGRGVLVLWNGQQQVTFGGHLDTGRPLLANSSLVASHEPPPYDPDIDAYVPSMFPSPPPDETEISGEAPPEDTAAAAEAAPAAQGDT